MESINLTHRIGRRVGDFLDKHDLILTSTIAKPPQKLGEMSMETTDVDGFVKNLFENAAPFTPLFNQTGGAAMSVPLSWSREGLPIGVHFGGRIGDEPKLIRLAAQLEQAQPWAHRRPPSC